jgi:hypothetical protein
MQILILLEMRRYLNAIVTEEMETPNTCSIATTYSPYFKTPRVFELLMRATRTAILVLFTFLIIKHFSV